MEDDLKKIKWKTPQKEIKNILTQLERRPQKNKKQPKQKMEDDLKKST